MLLVPVIISKVNNDRNKHWKGLIFIGFENIEEVVIFKEAHGPISHLQMNTSNTSYNSLEQLRDQVLYLINLTDFQYLLQFCQEKGLFNTVSEGPVFK